MILLFAVSTGTFSSPEPSRAAGPLKPRNLRCEYAPSPLGLDDKTPRLSWEVNDPRRGAVQTGYQILVASDLDALSKNQGDVWDAGKVESGQSIHVPYGGPPLESGRRYQWKVRTWDRDGQASPYSEPAWWEMGLLERSDFSAKWVTAPDVKKDPKDEIALGDWIWHPTERGAKQTVFFRASFEIDPGEKIDSAVVRFSADDRCVVHVNGKKLGENKSWKVLDEVNAVSAVKPGKNIVAVSATNGGGPCGLLLGMKIGLEGGRCVELKSGESWRTTAKAEGNWTSAEYDDSGWERVALVAKYGADPWGKPSPAGKPRRSLYMRKEVGLKGPIARARAYVSGLGCYEMRINGRRVGEDIFTPGWTHYPKRVQYQIYDVTELLHEGANAVGAVLGNGWWSSGLGWKGAARYSTENLRFMLQLNVEYADGTREHVVTDATWKAHPSPIVEDTFYHGETHDARLEMPGWDQPGFDESGWSETFVVDDPAELLVAQRCEPIRVTQELPVARVTQPAKGVYVFDFGQNLVGRVRLKVTGPRGTKVRIRFAEVLKDDGNIYTENYRSARATDVYILRGVGEEVWEPRFTYRGFRYAELTGYPGEPPNGALVARVLHSAAPLAGTFTCSNELINRIQRNITWGQRSNMHSVPTDCPQRDERLGWMGDAQMFAATSTWNMQMARFFGKWMRDIVDSQGEDGHVTDVAPVIVVSGPAAPAWGDAVVIIPWTVYQRYGDTRIIEENYDGMAAWVEYMHRHSSNHLYEREGYGDWVAPVASPKKPIGAGYYYYSTKLLSQMAAAIGRKEDAAKYAERARRIAEAFNAKYLDKKTNNYEGATQAANVLPMQFGIVPADRRAAVMENVVRDIASRDHHLSTGFLGTGYLMPLLSACGHHDVAYRLATQTTYPSWGHMIEKGATTIWELWNSDTKGPAMNSRNHFALGTVGQWFFENLAGVNPDPEAPGFKKIVIRPRPVADLEWARAEHASMYGRIFSEWRRKNGGLFLHVSIPANTSATVHVPTLGNKSVTITEGGKPILRNGKPHGNVPGVKFSHMEDDFAVFEVGAGDYAFTCSAR